MRRRDDWIDDDDYPTDDDVAEFGYDSPSDDHPLTIGYVGKRPPFWTRGRIVLLVVVLVLLASLLLEEVIGLFP